MPHAVSKKVRDIFKMFDREVEPKLVTLDQYNQYVGYLQTYGYMKWPYCSNHIHIMLTYTEIIAKGRKHKRS